MTSRTRRRLVVAIVVVILTFPLEVILFQAVSTDSDQAIQHWVNGLSADELDAAADVVQLYPFAYRRAIMKALTSAHRSEVWRNHIQQYGERPDLPTTAIPVLDAAIALASPAAFENPTADLRDQTAIVAEQLTIILGREQAEYLLYRLGPPDGTFASLEPIREKLANLVRTLALTLAREDECNCSLGFGCQGSFECTDETGCEPVAEWPLCGWFWNEECDGTCAGLGGGLP